MKLTKEQIEHNEKVKDQRTLTEIYSRIVGYIRPIQNYNPGKLEEYNDRKVFKVKK